MGFGFNLAIIFIILPISVLLLVLWMFFGNTIFIKIFIVLWVCFFATIFTLGFVAFLFSKKELEKEDYYGTYVIDRDFFKGKQADWQYNHFRFEIRENDSIYFYATEGRQIKQVYKGKINTIKPYKSARLIINMDKPTHHILTTNPTTYRGFWLLLGL